MKKLIVMMMLAVLPMAAMSQTKSVAAPIKVMGIPLGITAQEFRAKAESIKSQMPTLLGAKESWITISMYERGDNESVVWQATIVAENEYVGASAAGFRITSILSAKYGAPITTIHMDYGDCLRWNLKNGYILAWYKGKSFYAQFVDYNALKKAMPELYKQL